MVCTYMHLQRVGQLLEQQPQQLLLLDAALLCLLTLQYACCYFKYCCFYFVQDRISIFVNHLHQQAVPVFATRH